MANIALDGQVAVVTGGGRGLGRAMAQTLAAAGAAVAVVARSTGQVQETVSIAKQAGGRAIAIVADVADRQAVEGMMRTVERQLGMVDVLVNNAGVGTPIGPTWEVDPDAWWRNLEVNLRGPFLCARAVLPSMIQRRAGRIINVVSMAGAMGIPHLSPYVAAKTALARFSETLAVEVQAHNVMVFAIDPGTVRTAMTEEALESEAGRKWTPWFGPLFAEKRDVPPEQSAQLVLRLAAGQADQLSGCFISVADDLDELIEHAADIRQTDHYKLRRLS